MTQPLRIGFLGTGGIAAKHSRFLKDCPDATIVAGCDVTKEAVESLWRRTWDQPPAKAPAVYTDAASMYASEKLDGVVICTPHTLHHEQSVQALDAGCHVLLEKPMVTSAEHARDLERRVKQSGKTFVVAYNTPCTAEFAYLRSLIRGGEMGRLELVSGYLCQNWLALTVGKWRQDPALSGGGQAYDSGAHLLNSITWSVEAPIAEVFAFVDNHGAKVDINSAIAVRFENGVFASIAIGGNAQANGSHLTFIFERGKVDIDGWSGTWIHVTRDGQHVKYPPITADMDAGSPAANWIDAIRGRAEARTGPTNGVIHSELMDAIYDSAATNAPSRPKRNA